MEKYLGQTLKGRYQLNEIIGVGGMSVIYKAFDIVLCRDVSVKILKDEYMADEEFRRRFATESKAITLLSDKNIVDIYDVRMDGEVLFIAMEYLEGITLKQYIDKVGALKWREATHYIKQILSAVQHAHERGVVHRDLKPQNIMLARDGNIKVMDFGIAKVSDFETRNMNAQAIGSVHYISPEQASGDELDERTDIYSIGIMLYELCTGALPFDGDNAVSVALMQIQDQPALPRDLNAEIPVGLEQIILHAIMKDPLDRYDEASDMLRDIETIEEDPTFVFHEDEYAAVVLPKPESEPEEQPTAPVVIQEEPTLTKAEKRKLSTILPILAGLAAAGLFFICIALGMLFLPEMTAEKKYEVPNLIDKLLDDVLASDEYEKFNIVKIGEKASEKKQGTILSQSVPEFSMVVEGTTIEVYVSSGVSTVCLPDIIGMPIEKAKDLMESSQIPFKTIELFSDTVAKGHVIRTSVAPGDEVDVATQVVIIYVSKGSENDQVAIPDLTGMTVDEARAALANVGLTLNEKIEEEYSDTIDVGLVVRQSPNFDKFADKGNSVTIYISKGPDPAKEPEDSSLTVTVNFDNTFTGQTMTVTIMQDTTILGAQEVVYDNLTDGVFLWSGTAELDATVTVTVNGMVQDEIVIQSGLNTVTVDMTGGTYIPPDDTDDPETPDDQDTPVGPEPPIEPEPDQGEGGNTSPEEPIDPETPTDPELPTDPVKPTDPEPTV